MKKTIVKTRKFEGGKYTFILCTPEYEGEKGVLGIELQPYIYVETPENCFGYIDTFMYNHNLKDGYFSWRNHPLWIKRKLTEICGQIAENLPYSVY